MKRPLRPEELKIWGVVAGTVHPLPGRSAPKAAEAADAIPAPVVGKARPGAKAASAASSAPAALATPPAGRRPVAPPRQAEGRDPIEPRRKHRIVKEREEIGARLDLHGLDQDRAKLVLESFLVRAWDEGYRAVLVITGKGVQGDGILRRRTPEWLADRRLAHIVAGISEAARKHGGEGALYVALKRKPRG